MASSFGAASAISGILASLLAFVPSVATDSLYTPDDSVPLSTRFAVRNVSPITIREVTCGCVFVTIDGKRLEAERGGRIGNVLAITRPNSVIAAVLGSQQAATTDCNLVLGGTTSSDTRYDIVLVINYKPWWLPVRRTAMFRFSNSTDRVGQQHWVPQPATAELMNVVPKDWGGDADDVSFRLGEDMPMRLSR